MTAEAGPEDERVERLGEVLDRLASHSDEAVRAALEELLEGLHWLHAEGLERLVEILGEDPERFRRALDDPLVGNLLLLYDLAAVDERGRAQEALESMRPYLRSHGGEVDLLDVDEGVVRLRLLGACDGCPSSRATLTQGIERALAERLPGFRGIDVVGDGSDGAAPALDGPDRRAERESRGEPVSFVPEDRLVDLSRRLEEARGETPPLEDGRTGLAREAVMGPLDDLPVGAMHGALADNYPVLVVRLADEVVAWQNTCPGSLLPLHLGTLEGGVLACPWHGCRFDAATGERLEGAGASLHPLPVRVEDGLVKVEI